MCYRLVFMLRMQQIRGTAMNFYSDESTHIFCAECCEDLGDEDDMNGHEREGGTFCEKCAHEFDHICCTCGGVSPVDLVQDGKCNDDSPWMVCLDCKVKIDKEKLF